MSDGFAEVLLVFLRLGTSSFGGPVAHLGFFRAELVERRKWIDEAAFADIVALCQFLPGPASSQVAMLIGFARARWPGAAAAWIGFTAPSAALLYLFALGVSALGAAQSGALHGLKVVAVAVVAQAIWSMAQTLCADRTRATLAVASAAFVLIAPSTVSQLTAIGCGALLGRLWIPTAETAVSATPMAFRIPRSVALAALTAFVVLLLAPTQLGGSHAMALFASFFRSGALVFGGGHVVLPLLQQALVPPGFIAQDAFLAGYGAAQAVPGPLFTFAAYLGAAMQPAPNGLTGALLCLFAIYLPSFLLLVGVAPFWEELRAKAAAQSALKGVNAAVVGLLAAAFYDPVWTSAILTPLDFALALAALLLLQMWKTPAWAVVALGALAGGALAG
ncbi:MAG TPA: chromate efflux transporter [Methylocystis sp.]|nr:chromate efflux transporter [Methylocystis sp.]